MVVTEQQLKSVNPDLAANQVSSIQSVSERSLSEVPQDVDDVQQLPNINLSDASPSNIDVSQASSFFKGEEAATGLLGQKIDTQLKLLEQQQKTDQSALQNILKSKKSNADIQREQFESSGIQDLFQKKTKINAEAAELAAQESKTRSSMERELEAARQNEQGRFGPNAINNEMAAIQRKYAPTLNDFSRQMNIKAAQISSLNGDVQQATQFMNMAINAAVADEQFKVDTMLEFRDSNNELFKNINSIYSDAFDSAIAIQQREVAFARDKALIQLRKEGLDTSGLKPTDGFFNIEVEASVREDAVALLAKGTPQQAFASLRLLYSEQEVTDEALKQALGLIEAPQTTDEGGGKLFGGFPESVDGRSGASFFGEGLRETVTSEPFNVTPEESLAARQSVKDFFSELFGG